VLTSKGEGREGKWETAREEIKKKRKKGKGEGKKGRGGLVPDWESAKVALTYARAVRAS